MRQTRKRSGRSGNAVSAPKKKGDGDSISFSELSKQLRDERGRRNARMKARIEARIKALMELPPGTIVEAERRLTEVEDLHQLLNESRQGRPRDESAAKAHIRAKLAEYPDIKKPMALRKLCDEQMLDDMSR